MQFLLSIDQQYVKILQIYTSYIRANVIDWTFKSDARSMSLKCALGTVLQKQDGRCGWDTIVGVQTQWLDAQVEKIVWKTETTLLAPKQPHRRVING